MTVSDDTRHRAPRSRNNLLYAIVALLAFLALIAIAFFLTDLTDGGMTNKDKASEKVGAKAGQPYEVSASELRTFGNASDVPVYWAGEEKDTRLELTRTDGGEVYVRYLTGKAKPGDKNPLYLTVGTYPTNNAYKTLEDQKDDEGVLTEEAPGGGIAIHRKDQLNAYLAYPGQDVVVEVYAPQPDKALRLITEGDIGVIR